MKKIVVFPSCIFFFLCLVLFLWLGPSQFAGAQPYPSKVVKIVVAYAAGGSNDLIARLLAQKLTGQLGRQVIVENRPGAGSNIGSDYVAKSSSDGYVMLLGSSANAVNASLYASMSYNPQRDLAPVTLIGTSPNVLVVHPSLPVKSVREFIALAKSKPGSITYASSGSGGAMHLSGELFKLQAGVDLLHVPYKGGGPAVSDLLGGHVSAMFDNVITAIPNIKTGKVRALGVTTLKRADSLPELPTIAESGLPGYDAFVWWGMFAPAGTSREIIARIQNEVSRAIKMQEIHAKFRSQGVSPSGSTSQEFDRFFREELEKWAKVVKQAGIRVD